ncbi:BCL2/adenovirus E1B 19 kDa protein-interacting protein 2 [Drosophila guanche]|uniref:Blast:Microspherule protein 1 n=1 Tax=Drosophila guanche TaxID=7266 RepID=A0A3B0JV61_DROGU|nr:BCL2/adenovirus E1B 19 kDa protein-interacting protein 2 [Drosophila guanche]SPP84953.1 blast:Microspherule protein 1 [Drosophila guanche]
MSFHYAESESSQSESKMDISETPTDSTGISPLADECTQVAAPQVKTILEETTKTSATLDNRIMRPELLSIETMPQRQIIERTLANSHPLMSPTNTDSDSEPFQTKRNNFPDVVPTTEAAVQAKNTLNQQAPRNKPKDAKVSLLRANSPDILSSESDADVSQYLAAVESNFQSVSLLPNANGKKTKRCSTLPGGEDISSLDSISNHSFDDDEDIEHNLASLSPSSSLIDGLDGEDDDDDCEGPELLPDNDDDLDLEFGLATTPTPHTPAAATLPQYSAAEERRDSRNWQKITLPDGRTREIDMRVIEPYKRVLSHGGYLKSGGQNAIVIFCACHLPDRSRADYSYVMDNLFLYVVKTLEQLVTDDYVLIYLHGGSNRRNVPPFPWLKRCYQLLDRRLRKSLKHMYLVHPTFWIKSLVWMARPFVSTKFWRKLIYVKSLEELGLHVAVEKAAIPEKVKQYDAKRH